MTDALILAAIESAPSVRVVSAKIENAHVIVTYEITNPNGETWQTVRCSPEYEAAAYAQFLPKEVAVTRMPSGIQANHAHVQTVLINGEVVYPPDDGEEIIAGTLFLKNDNPFGFPEGNYNLIKLIKLAKTNDQAVWVCEMLER